MDTANVKALLEKINKARASMRTNMKFGEYLKEVMEDRITPRTAHRLMAEAVLSGDVNRSEETREVLWGFLDGKLFGFRTAMMAISRFFSLDMRDRILLLAGPVSSGKSSLVQLLKERLEEYSATDEGAVWTILDCPIQEDPLALIPDGVRSSVQEMYKAIYPERRLQIEGDLCPPCAAALRDVEDVSEVTIERVVLSESAGRGISTRFDFAMHKETPLSALTGRVVAEPGVNGAGGAGSRVVLNGLLNSANRGITDIDNVFNASTPLLRELMSVAARREVRIPGGGSVHTDTLVIAQTTFQEYQTAMMGEMAEEVRERFYVVKIPFPFRMAEELRVYRMMMKSQLRLNDPEVHRAPNMFRSVAQLGLITRIDRVKTNSEVPVLDKVRAYSGEPVSGLDGEALTQERLQCPEEGLYGLSPRYLINRLESLATDPAIRCIGDLTALKYISEKASKVELDAQGVVDSEMGIRLEAIVEDVMRRVTKDLRKAHSDGFKLEALRTRSFYVEQATKVLRCKDEDFLEVPRESEYHLRQLEDRIDVLDQDRDDMRREIVELYQMDPKLPYDADPRLRDMIEAKLLSPLDRVKSDLKGGDKGRKNEWLLKRNAVHDRLIQDYSYCHICAVNLVDLVLNGPSQLLTTRQGTDLNWQWEASQDPGQLLRAFRNTDASGQGDGTQ